MVRIPAGKSLTRAFRMEDVPGIDLQNRLSVQVDDIADGTTQVRMSAEQFRSGTTQK